MVDLRMWQHTLSSTNMGFGIGNIACSQPVNESWMPGGLKLYLDAGNVNSYRGGSLWADMSGNNNNFTVSPSAYNGTGPVKYMNFNGSYGCAKKTDSDMIISGNVTAIIWTRVSTNTSDWRTLFRALSSGGDHQVIINTGNILGMYDNTNASAFNTTGYNVTNIPGYGTTKWACMVWRWNDAVQAYYNYSYADQPIYIPAFNTSVNSRFKGGICSIGAYNNSNQSDPMSAAQYWGDIAMVMIWNRVLRQDEVVQVYRGTRDRFGLGQNNIVDSGFETPNEGASWAYQPGGALWTLNSSCGYTGTNGVWQTGASKDGNNALFMQGAGAWTSQSINTIPNKVYRVRVWGKSRILTWGPLAFDMTFNGVPLGNSAIYFPQSDTAWSQYEGYFTASTTTTQIGFIGVNPLGGDRSVLLDAVEIGEV